MISFTSGGTYFGYRVETRFYYTSSSYGVVMSGTTPTCPFGGSLSGSSCVRVTAHPYNVLVSYGLLDYGVYAPSAQSRSVTGAVPAA